LAYSRVETRTRSVPGFFMRARQQHEVRPHRSRDPHPQFVAKKEHLHEARFLPNEANRRKALSTKELSVRAASHSGCGADGYSPHGNSRKSQQDYKQRFMTITSQPPSTQRKPCNFADPNGSRQVCNLRPACLLFSVIDAIALFAPLFFFWQVRILWALLARRPVFSCYLQGMQRGAVKGAVSALHLNHSSRTLVIGGFGCVRGYQLQVRFRDAGFGGGNLSEWHIYTFGISHVRDSAPSALEHDRWT
jgi:hypothetical protein